MRGEFDFTPRGTNRADTVLTVPRSSSADTYSEQFFPQRKPKIVAVGLVVSGNGVGVGVGVGSRTAIRSESALEELVVFEPVTRQKIDLPPSAVTGA